MALERNIDSGKGSAPIVIEAQSHQARRRNAYRPEAYFVAQLLAQRPHQHPNRRHYARPGTFVAQTAYRANAERIVKRMPAGYNRSVDA